MTLEELRDWVREWTQPQPRDSILPVLDEAIRERDVLRKRIDDAPVAELYGWPIVWPRSGERNEWAPIIILQVEDGGAPIKGPYPKRLRLVVENENG